MEVVKSQIFWWLKKILVDDMSSRISTTHRCGQKYVCGFWHWDDGWISRVHMSCYSSAGFTLGFNPKYPHLLPMAKSWLHLSEKLTILDLLSVWRSPNANEVVVSEFPPAGLFLSHQVAFIVAASTPFAMHLWQGGCIVVLFFHRLPSGNITYWKLPSKVREFSH